MLLIVPAYGQDTVPVPVITGPTGGQPGDLLILDASESSAKHFEWAVVPTLSRDRLTIMPIEDGKKCILVSVPGQYTVILAVSTDAGVIMKKHVVTVSDYPGPGPNPGPEPKPPEPPRPQPDPEFPDGKYDLAEKSYKWAKEVGDPGTAQSLANNFDSVSAQISAGALKSMLDIQKATKDLNSVSLKGKEDKWGPFTGPLKAELMKLNESGKLRSFDDHAIAWAEIAQGLREVK